MTVKGGHAMTSDKSSHEGIDRKHPIYVALIYIGLLGCAGLAMGFLQWYCGWLKLPSGPPHHILSTNAPKHLRTPASGPISIHGQISLDFEHQTPLHNIRSHVSSRPPTENVPWPSLSRCNLVTSDVRPDSSNLVLVTNDVVVLQDRPVGSPGLVRRYLAFRLPDGHCREEGSLQLECDAREDQQYEDPCTIQGAPKFCVAAAQQKCRMVSPPPFIRGELSAGVLGAWVGAATKHSGTTSKAGLSMAGTSTGLVGPRKLAERKLRQPSARTQSAADLRVLALGTGAGSIPAYFANSFPYSSITTVDISPSVIFAAEHHVFHSHSDNIHYVLGDAGEELEKQPDGSVDVIYIDAYDPHDTAPKGLYARESIAIAKRKLRAGGRLVMLAIHAATPSLGKDLTELGFEEVDWSTDTGESQSFPVVVGRVPGGPAVFNVDLSDSIKNEMIDWQSQFQWHSSAVED